MSTSETRKKANILITGTPGTGKTTLSLRLAQELNYESIDVSKVVKEKKFYTEYDNLYDSYVLDEEKILDFLEEKMGSDDGGVIIDYHSSDFFPERWFDIIVVLRCDNTEIFYDRLIARNYKGKKLKENLECEIFGTVEEEAINSYNTERIHKFSNNTLEELNNNIRQISKIIYNLKK